MSHFAWFMVTILDKRLVPIRRWLYSHGFKPRPGSIFYSPSMALLPPPVKVNHKEFVDETLRILHLKKQEENTDG